MIFKKIPAWAIILIIMVVIVAVALWLRVGLPHSQVFVNSWVKLTGVDAYYYGRLVDNLVQHFPLLTQFDPYYIFPKGASTTVQPNFFAYFMAGIIWLLGVGKPDQHFADVVMVYIPPVLAVCTILAAFFIGKMLKNAWAGLLAAGMLAVMPGEFLNRSLLGYTDHHIAEVLFVACFIVFVLLAFKDGEDMDAEYFSKKGWRIFIKPAVYCVLAGLFMALYMLTWAGAALLLLIFMVFMVIQIIINYVRDRSEYPTGVMGVVILVVGLCIYMPAARSNFSSLALVGAIAVTTVLTVIAVIMKRRRIRGGYFILTIFIAGVLSAGVVYLAMPDIFILMIDRLMAVFGWYPDTTIMEMQPLLLQRGDFTFAVAYGNFTIGLILGLAGLVLVIYHAVKQPDAVKILLAVWTVLMVLAALAMRRFSYYLAVPVAILSAYFIWWVLGFVGFGRQRLVHSTDKPVARTKAARLREAKEERASRGNPVFMSIFLAIALFVIIYPNLGPLPDGSRPAIDVATRPLFAPTDAWFESLEWLRSNSPEPLDNAETYYGLYKSPDEPGGYIYPQNAYGVLAWWDYGYWITRIGRRIPFSNPGTSGIGGEAYYLLAQDEKTAIEKLEGTNIKYFIMDNEIASYEGKYFALANWYGGSYHDYYDVFLKKKGSEYTPVIAFYPSYYQSMVIRMYNFDGQQVIPKEITVVGYDNVIASDDRQYMAINDTRTFSSVEEAEKFINSQKPKMYQIVSFDPYVSAVPLEALRDHKLVYSSSQKKKIGDVVTPYIKIFQYQP